MRILNTRNRQFRNQWDKMLEATGNFSPAVERSVDAIIRKVRRNGDRSLFALTKQFDRYAVSKRNVRVTPAQIKAALKQVSRSDQRLLKRAATRVLCFHRQQKVTAVAMKTSMGRMGLRWTPLERVGLYVPGGQAAYPSTVLMNAIPAQVAGVKDIVMVTPTPDGRLNPYTLATAQILGIKEIYRVGGAQAVAALAYGTESIPAVDKIVGPGNAYVAAAKRKVFGHVDIDMIAGPTEVLVLTDRSANAEFVASDLLSQAEHDADARPVLITTSTELAGGAVAAVQAQLKKTARRDIAAKALRRNGLVIVVKSRQEALALANEMAPEHLLLMVSQPKAWLDRLKNAGAIFIGHNTPVACGDYAVGPNHVLPTGRSARFASPLGVYDFMKASSTLELSRKGLAQLSSDIVQLAELEGLIAHGDSVKIRLK